MAKEKIKDSRMKDVKVRENYHVEEYASDVFYVDDPEGSTAAGPFKTRGEAQRECDKKNQSKDSIKDLQTKAAKARSMGYDSAPYEAEIKKLMKDAKEWKVFYKKHGTDENAIFENEKQARDFMNKLIEEKATHIRLQDPSKDSKDEEDIYTKDPLKDSSKDSHSITYEQLMKKIKEGYIEIEYWSGDPKSGVMHAEVRYNTEGNRGIKKTFEVTNVPSDMQK